MISEKYVNEFFFLRIVLPRFLENNLDQENETFLSFLFRKNSVPFSLLAHC